MCYFFLLILILLSGATLGQDANPAPALGFLRIEPDARGSALGLSGAASSPDNFSAFYNPGKLSHLSGREYGISVGFAPYLSKLLKGVGLASVQGFRRISESAVLGLDIRFFSLGKTEFKDESGYNIYTYSPTEWSIGMTYSRQLSSYTGIGVTARYISSRPALGIQYQGAEIRAVNAAGADIGFYYCNVPYDEQQSFSGGVLRGGISLGNLGTKVRYHSVGAAAFQPMNLRAGLSYTFPSESHDHVFSIQADINKLMVPPAAQRDAAGNIISGHDPNQTSVPGAFFAGLGHLQSLGIGGGVEYVYKGLFALRAGSYYESPQFSSRQLATAGIGLYLGTFHLDMSYFASLGSASEANTQAQTFKIALGVIFNSE